MYCFKESKVSNLPDYMHVHVHIHVHEHVHVHVHHSLGMVHSLIYPPYIIR